MTVLKIILGLSILVGIVFAVFRVYSYADKNYSLNIFGFGGLSLIPPVLASLGFFVTANREKDYWEALRHADLDILVSMGSAAIAFVWILMLISRRTNFWIALFTMLVVPIVVVLVGLSALVLFLR